MLSTYSPLQPDLAIASAGRWCGFDVMERSRHRPDLRARRSPPPQDGNDSKRVSAAPDAPSSRSPGHDAKPAAMAIPGVRQDYVPPALPPTRWNQFLDDGLDLSWKWGNPETEVANVKPGSSLRGGFLDRRPSYNASNSPDQSQWQNNATRPGIEQGPNSRSNFSQNPGRLLPEVQHRANVLPGSSAQRYVFVTMHLFQNFRCPTKLWETCGLPCPV